MASLTSDYRIIQIHRYLKFIRRLGIFRGTYSYIVGHFLKGEHKHRIPYLNTEVLARSKTSDIDTFEQIFIRKEYESYLTNNKSSMTIIDGGANVGYAAIYFAAKFPHARILCIEPDTANYALLQQNTAHLVNVTTIRGALWPNKTTLKISNPHDAPWAFKIAEDRKPKDPEQGVTAVTIEDTLQWADNSIDILKLDVEGAERTLFASPKAKDWCEHSDIIIIELHDIDVPGCSYAFYKALLECGSFRQTIHGEYVLIDRRLDPSKNNA